MATVHKLQSGLDDEALDPIRKIHVFSTGRAFQHKEHRNGSMLPQLWWVLTSQSWIGLPISVFLIEHEDGLILFDTGLDPAIKTSPHYISQAIGRVLLKRIFRFEIGEEHKLGCLLRSKDIDPERVRSAIISHLHFDHVGGIADIPQADLLVSAEEWAQLSKPHPERDWILKEHLALDTAKWKPIEFQPGHDPLLAEFGGTFDVMGDGSLLLLPTPGHTPGSMSLLVRSKSMPPLLFIGDLAYSADAILADRVPGTGDRNQLRATYAKVRNLKQSIPNLLIVPSHDDDATAQMSVALKTTTDRR